MYASSACTDSRGSVDASVKRSVPSCGARYESDLAQNLNADFCYKRRRKSHLGGQDLPSGAGQPPRLDRGSIWRVGIVGRNRDVLSRGERLPSRHIPDPAVVLVCLVGAPSHLATRGGRQECARRRAHLRQRGSSRQQW